MRTSMLLAVLVVAMLLLLLVLSTTEQRGVLDLGGGMPSATETKDALPGTS